MYRVSIQGVDERMINLHYYHYYSGQLQHSRSNRNHHCTSSPATTAPQVQLPLDLKSNYHWTSNYHIVVSLMPHDAHLPAENKAAFTLCTNLAWTPPAVQAPSLSEIISAVVWWVGLWAKHRDRVSNLVFYTQSTLAVISGTGDRTQRVKAHNSSTTVGRKEVTSG